MVKTYPCQNVPDQNVPTFGQNVPTFLVKTYPVHQNVPNLLVKTYPIYFFLIFNISFYFFVKKKSFAHWSKRTQHLFQSKPFPYEKELYQNICDIYLKYIAHICKLYVFTMWVYVSYMYMLHICRIRSHIYVTYM